MRALLFEFLYLGSIMISSIFCIWSLTWSTILIESADLISSLAIMAALDPSVNWDGSWALLSLETTDCFTSLLPCNSLSSFCGFDFFLSSRAPVFLWFPAGWYVCEVWVLKQMLYFYISCMWILLCLRRMVLITRSGSCCSTGYLTLPCLLIGTSSSILWSGVHVP